jgi:hypothetical protein
MERANCGKRSSINPCSTILLSDGVGKPHPAIFGATENRRYNFRGFPCVSREKSLSCRRGDEEAPDSGSWIQIRNGARHADAGRARLWNLRSSDQYRQPSRSKDVFASRQAALIKKACLAPRGLAPRAGAIPPEHKVECLRESNCPPPWRHGGADTGRRNGFNSSYYCYAPAGAFQVRARQPESTVWLAVPCLPQVLFRRFLEMTWRESHFFPGTKPV